MSRDGARVLVVSCAWAGRAAPEELLGPRERARAAELTGPRRAEWVRTRLTAKAAVLWATGGHGAQIPPGPDGAPRLLGAPRGTALSLTHTGELAACAVSRGGPADRVGVDVEPVDARNDVLLARLLAPGERPDAATGPLPHTGPPGLLATVLVACKEAALKACRRPSPALRDYELRAGADGRLRVLVRIRGRRQEAAASGVPDALEVWWSCRRGRVTAVCGTGRRPPEHRDVPADRVLAALGPRRGGQ
ncbi:4'-phosphopantetheinyl transferase family protein [Streptomyces sp. WMMC897]|uniref:4'-phosphopantetheinyl transferase family protein n=1 Tax=Streptomyces sp. WMMC897 TaxID=3014782 RepID=UPI0022B7220A|nr:hypothetical protein [Streptomyces sp. WMMC897]MCZ7415186.1 hypothetical protein [Streptomyces sp. WMMC897]